MGSIRLTTEDWYDDVSALWTRRGMDSVDPPRRRFCQDEMSVDVDSGKGMLRYFGRGGDRQDVQFFMPTR